MRSVIAYTTARILIFLATLGVLSLTPLRNEAVFLLLAAVLLSGLISYVLLSAQRDRVSAAVTAGARRQREKIEQARTKEDA